MAYNYGSEDPKSWTLRGIDSGFESEFRGQYIGTNMEETVGSNFGETTTVNKDQPDFQWVSGEADRFTFTTRIFADNATKNVKQQVNLLKSYAKRDKTLKRAPRFIFSAGTEISFTCFVRQVKFVYDEFRIDGTIRGAVISITLQPIDPEISENAATNLTDQITQAAGVKSPTASTKTKGGETVKISGASLHTIDRKYTAKYGDTFESIAALEYGNALLGDVLRRLQPDKLQIQPGDEIKLVEASEIRRIKVTPQSIPMKRTPTNRELQKKFLEKHNTAVTIFV